MPLFKRSSKGPPKAFSVQTSGEFDAYDGSWSTFNLNVGPSDNPQSFRFLPSTSFSTWLPNSQDFNTSEFDNPSLAPSDIWAYAKSRGVGLYDKNQSTGFVDPNSIGQFKLTDLGELGKTISPTNAFGTKYNDSAGDLSLQNLSLSSALATAVSEINTSSGSPVFSISDWHYYLPTLGLGFGNLNVGNVNYSSASSLLASAGTIPSRSWGYTAGASYGEFQAVLSAYAFLVCTSPYDG
jgi:hypothetical protein